MVSKGSRSRPGSAAPAPGSGNASSDLLKILQRQKQENLRIAKDPIFKEYHAQVKLREIKLRCKGWKDVAKPQIDEDLDAEAMQRMVTLVSSSAAENGRQREGVWAKFGKPYKPLGVFREVCARGSEHCKHELLYKVGRGPATQDGAHAAC